MWMSRCSDIYLHFLRAWTSDNGCQVSQHQQPSAMPFSCTPSNDMQSDGFPFITSGQRSFATTDINVSNLFGEFTYACIKRDLVFVLFCLVVKRSAMRRVLGRFRGLELYWRISSVHTRQVDGYLPLESLESFTRDMGSTRRFKYALLVHAEESNHGTPASSINRPGKSLLVSRNGAPAPLFSGTTLH